MKPDTHTLINFRAYQERQRLSINKPWILPKSNNKRKFFIHCYISKLNSKT